MSLWESITVALEGLAANKMRAALTMLGVIIGVSAVITMLALASGAQNQAMEHIQQMGTNVLTVFTGRNTKGKAAGSFGSNEFLTLDDVEAIAKDCPSVKSVAPEAQTTSQVKYKNENTNTTILGTSPEYLGIRNYQVEEGRIFTAGESKSYKKVAVIGPTTAETLFGTSSPIGQNVRIAGTQFKIIGIFKSKGSAGSFSDPDDRLVIPITTCMRRLMGTQYIRAIDVQANSQEVMDQASSELDALIRKRHKIAADDEESFRVRNQTDMIEMAESMGEVFSLLLGGIASVSLLVGGIGIMNIMLVSVTERTREIGIRKALGARGRDIQMQFLVEALVLSLLGGTVGVLVGILGSMLVGKLTSMNATVSMVSVVLSFGFSAFVGIFFGYYPARQASRLNPIEALRYE
ncbi:MAG: ABC transporter permease [Armatimonadota bacterium]|nr:ABC transporter permease [bacterium]